MVEDHIWRAPVGEEFGDGMVSATTSTSPSSASPIPKATGFKITMSDKFLPYSVTATSRAYRNTGSKEAHARLIKFEENP